MILFKLYIVFDISAKKVLLRSSDHVEPSRMEILEELDSTVPDNVRIDKCKYWIRILSPYIDVEPLKYYFVNVEGTKNFYCSRPDSLPRRFRNFIRVN